MFAIKEVARYRNGRTHSVTYMSNNSRNEMISLLGDAVRKKVITEVKYSGMYSLLADTTPDLSRHDQLAVVIRSMKETGPTERLLALKYLSAKTGVATAEDIVKVLQYICQAYKTRRNRNCPSHALLKSSKQCSGWTWMCIK